MDDLLHDYFQSEMPKPWPAFKAPKGMRTKPPVSFWSRYSGRLAIAACIAALVAGYLTLGAFFPRTVPTSGVQDLGRDMSHREQGPKTPKTTPQKNSADDATEFN